MAHRWITIPVGRVCARCSRVQMRGEFIEDTCAADRRTESIDPDPPSEPKDHAAS